MSSLSTFNYQPQVPQRPRRRAQSVVTQGPTVTSSPRRSLFELTSSEEGTSQIRIKVIAGHTLAKKDIFGASDPYVRIDLNTINGNINIDSVLTKTKKKTLNPKWNEEFVFRVKPGEHKLVFQVFDENRLTRDDFLGMVELTLVNLPKEQEGRTIPPKSYPLRPRRSVGARSRVRGTLDIYHAFIRDLDSTSETSDWEIVDDGASNSDSSGTPINASSLFGSSGVEALPQGWEERQDANGRTYYVNHIARTTQWERPTALTSSGVSEEEMNNAAAEFHRRFHISVDESDSRSNQGDNMSLSSEMGFMGSVTSLNDLNRSGSMSSNHSTTGRPTRPAPSIPRDHQLHRTNATRRKAPIPPSRLTTSPVVSEGGSSGPSRRHLPRNRNSLEDNEEQSNSENEDLDTSDSGAVTNNQVRSPSTPQSRQSSTEDNSATSSPDTTASSNPDTTGLPPGWSMQVAPNGRIFFIDHNERKTSWVDPRTGRASPMPNAAGRSPASRKPEDDLGPLPEGWEERVHSDGRIFYIDHNTRITQWEDPRMSNPNIAGQAVPYSRDYKQKYEYFKSQLRKPTSVPNKFEIKVRRASIFEDSYRVLNSVTKTDLLKTKLWVEFEGEVGLDYGGLAREWFFLLSKEMFNPYYGLFEYSAMDNYTLQINPFSGLCNEEHLNYFKFIGRVAGMAVYHGKLLDAFFIRPFYKMMLQKPIDLKDMEAVDMEYYNSLLWIKENDPSELMLTFCIDEETFGTTNQRELKPNGANIDVTNENKDEYIRLVIEWRFVSRVKEQMHAFLDGFGSVVPLNSLKIFDENELELLMCGIQNIDVKDWKKNTLYKGDYYANHVIVQWFWRAVLSFSNEMRARLLQFVTGTSRVPMNGFKELYGSNGPQMFTIEKWGNPENFPRAHTCFNRLDLPPYESYLQLKDKLIKAIEGSQGFAGVD
ncbi:E3 ubiquitin-protein ligase Nedd-4 isoform X1 [Phlebotomus argentipes]|uniref:E3 ubiquitin-protein ligase Nedd-4 isoform X1 n=1 Tax=Phlebotomus argentipes TaxID=94469 RepID=UPI0028933A13|nr:E3 ubiquitin-protein ligase Nedd-4 isoform X1 [Phlebotomus argentipes]